MGTLMELDPATEIHPGHAEPTTVAQEWEHNPFIRIWRGLDRGVVEFIGVGACTAGLAAIEAANGRHVRVVQIEVEDFEIGLHPLSDTDFGKTTSPRWMCQRSTT